VCVYVCVYVRARMYARVCACMHANHDCACMSERACTHLHICSGGVSTRGSRPAFHCQHNCIHCLHNSSHGPLHVLCMHARHATPQQHLLCLVLQQEIQARVAAHAGRFIHRGQPVVVHLAGVRPPSQQEVQHILHAGASAVCGEGGDGRRAGRVREAAEGRGGEG